MARQVVLAHPLVGAEGDHHRDLLRPAVESRVRGPHEQRQRARPGAVRHDQAHPLAIKVGAGERLCYKSGDLIAGQFLVDTAHDVRPRRIARICAVIRRRFCRCRGRHGCILHLSAGHTSTVASTAAAGQDRLVTPEGCDG